MRFWSARAERLRAAAQKQRESLRRLLAERRLLSQQQPEAAAAQGAQPVMTADADADADADAELGGEGAAALEESAAALEAAGLPSAGTSRDVDLAPAPAGGETGEARDALEALISGSEIERAEAADDARRQSEERADGEAAGGMAGGWDVDGGLRGVGGVDAAEGDVGMLADEAGLQAAVVGVGVGVGEEYG